MVCLHPAQHRYDRHNGSVRYAIVILLAGLLFGTTGTAQALGPADATPLSVGAVRLAIGGTALGVLAFVLAGRRRRSTGVPRRPIDARSFALMAATGLSLWIYQPLFFFGTERNGVAVGTVVALGSTPIMAGLAEWALTRRRPTLIWMCATALATGGVALLAFGGAETTGADPLGLLGSLGAGASFAVIAVAQRRLLDGGWDSFTVVGAMGAISAVPSIISLPFLRLEWVTSSLGVVTALWLGIATLAVAYAMFTWGLSGLTAATAATLALAEPLTAAVLGVVVLKEELSALAGIGLVVLATGLIVLAWGSRARRDPIPFAIEG